MAKYYFWFLERHILGAGVGYADKPTEASFECPDDPTAIEAKLKEILAKYEFQVFNETHLPQACRIFRGDEVPLPEGLRPKPKPIRLQPPRLSALAS